ncbi:MAG: glycosyltransferase [Deltaproteobacteria bacterium]|nr:glycosyltransferase [Deltaproteobacteria bacterium]
MRRVLVVAYQFPPMGGGGVQRTLSFVRHLPEQGILPVVLTAAQPERYWAQDPSLLARIPDGVEIIRASDRALFTVRRALRRALPASARPRLDQLLDLPDRQATWWPAATVAALQRARRGDLDAVYSTSAPWTDHLVARALVRRTGLRWVADFRDPWTQNQTFVAATPLHRALQERWEAAVLAEADAVVANTHANAAALAARFPQAAGKTDVLPNGWESDELRGLPAPPPGGPLVIGYAGSFYPGYQPDAFYRHLKAALGAAPGLQVNLRMCGKTEQADAIRQAGLQGVVEERGYLPQAEALAHLAASHAVLFVLPPTEGRSGWVPQKLYVYLALGRPVVAVCPPGEARDILREAGGNSLVLDPDDPDGGPRLAGWLTELAARRTAPAGFEPQVVARYDRRALTARLAALLGQPGRGL